MTFLKEFFEKELYSQNSPLETDDFIKYCENLGFRMSHHQLESLERHGLLYPIFRFERPVYEDARIEFLNAEKQKMWRPAIYGLREGESEIRRYSVKCYESLGFYGRTIAKRNENVSEPLVHLCEKGHIFDPLSKPFREWATFKGEELEHDNKTVLSYFSAFQLLWLDKVLESTSLKLNFTSIDQDKAIRYVRTSYEDLNATKEQLLVQKEKFDRILNFLLRIQSTYIPYARSGSRSVQVQIDLKMWRERKSKFDLKLQLRDAGVSIEEIAELYSKLCRKANKILGDSHSEILQLWKNIDWYTKDKMRGDFRRGIEYLQWALMIKRVIEDFLRRETFDIDEVDEFGGSDFLYIDPKNVTLEKDFGASRRAFRHHYHFDHIKKKSHYHDTYARLFYLANSLGIDYQPRVLVFVEGETEEEVLPEVFEWYFDKPESHGIEIINFKGITSFYSPELTVKSGQRYSSSWLSNFTHLISYNLNKWQIIPFLIGDNEGEISKLLNAGIVINFDGKKYKLPPRWKHIWNVKQNDSPFCGKDFEFVNFTDEEIAVVLTKVLAREITKLEVQKVRKNSDGIKKIDPKISEAGIKVKIARNLFKNLFDLYAENKDEKILLRPVFKIIDDVFKIATLNHPPRSDLDRTYNRNGIRKDYLSGLEI